MSLQGEAFRSLARFRGEYANTLLGDNSELGGKVAGGRVRWNFFPDLTVTVADETWVKDGKLVAP